MSMAARSFTADNLAEDRIRRDSLITSVAFLVVLSCIQPLVTFLRGVLFCRWLDPAQLGCWDMVLGFLTIVSPIVVLGIPGSFGRYVEHYSQRGQLSMFLKRTTWTCGVLTALAITLVTMRPEFFSYLIFGQTSLAHLVYAVAIGMAAMIAFGYVVELLTALRMFRVVSALHFVKGTTFALAGFALLLFWRRDTESIVLGFAMACLLPVLVSVYWLVPLARSLPPPARREEEHYVTHRALWVRFLPFAVGIWFANFFTNLFSIVDRYMIIHFGSMANEEALAQVGHYHSSRILPLLLLAFMEMLAGIVLPHLSRTWEAGRRDEVGRQVILGFKLCGLTVSAGAAAVIFVAPWVFDVGFGGKYNGGLTVLPWTLIYCAWFGMYFILQKYVWCAERIRLCIIALSSGIVLNIGLNLLLLPHLGLLGAVLATAASKLLVVLLVAGFSAMVGMRLDWRMLVVLLLPLSLCLGGEYCLAILGVAALAILSTEWILTADEKHRLMEVAKPGWQRFQHKLGS